MMSLKAYAKRIGKDASSSIKKGVKNYQSDLDKAYTKGYQSGWADANKIPKSLGSRTSASLGYSRGLVNHQQSDSYNKRYTKYR